jgi:selenocysteine lyase/cysteine desulfurase
MDNMPEIRKQFPITQNMTYLDAARIVPPPQSVVEAVTSLYRDMHIQGEDRPGLEKKGEDAREKFAEMINASPEEVVFIKNTTEGLNIAANGLPLKPGDNVVISDLEHLNNVYPWTNLQERRGIEVRILKSRDGRIYLDDLKTIVDQRTRALSLSFVTFTGLRINLESFGQFCRSHDIYFIVDGIQGVGRIKLDVKEALVDIMSCGGHKGLMGGRGIGCLYIGERVIDATAVTYAGPPLADRHAVVSTDIKRSAGVGKFNAGGANYLGICALQAGLEYIHSIGLEDIESYDLKLEKRLLDGLAAIRGIEILSPLKPDESSGIVSIRTPDNLKVARGLEDRKIRVSSRGSGIRIAPHFFNTEEEIDRAVLVLEELLVRK